jgi:hypothetical protein
MIFLEFFLPKFVLLPERIELSMFAESTVAISSTRANGHAQEVKAYDNPFEL